MVDVQTVGVLVTAASVSVAAIYYAMVLREQRRNVKATLETRKLQLITGLSQDLFNEEGFRKYGELMNMEWRDYDEFERKYGSDFNLDNYGKRYSTITAFNTVGSLLREKLVEPDTLYGIGMFNVCYLWAKFEDVIKEQRRRYMGADYCQDLELLVKEMMRIKVTRDPSYKLPETFIKYIPNK